MNDYVINLRKNAFPVVVYEENLDRLFKAEAEWIAALDENAEASPQEARQRLEEATRYSQP